MHILKNKDLVLYYRRLGVKIGDGTKLYNVKIDYGHAYLAEIGKKCILSNCWLLTHDASTYIPFKKSVVGSIKIGNEVFVGAQSIILPGVTIGDRVIVGANSVVTHNISSNSVVAGNPARFIKTYDDFISKHEILMNESPVWKTYWGNKTSEEKEEMKVILAGGVLGMIDKLIDSIINEYLIYDSLLLRSARSLFFRYMQKTLAL